MKRIITLAAMLIFLIGISTATTVRAADATYVGADKCKVCHLSKKKGAQYKVWQGSKHAKAFVTLATPEAREAGKKVGVADPQKSEKCLKCHTPSLDVDPALISSTFKVDQGVQCESCHGPGSDHVVNMKAMLKTKDKSTPMAIDKIELEEKSCVKCHNSESPNYKPFVFDEFWTKIAHSKPE